MDFELTVPQKELAERAYKVGRGMREAAVEWDRLDQAPWGFMRDTLRDAGLLGLTMPTEYGGQGLTALDYVLAIEGVFRGAQTWVVPEPMFCSSGPGPSIMMLGTPEMREYYLPKVVTGELGVAISLSEPDHGSDLTDLETVAVRDGDDYIVTGRKAFISGAGVNELHATFVRFDGIPGHQGVGALVIEDPSPGLRTERGYEFVGDRGLPHGDVFLDEVRVPARNLLIGPGQFGRLMSAFNMERLHNATLCLGLAEAAFDEASDFVKNRKTFGRPVLEFQSVYHELADIWTEIEGHRLLVHRAATNARDGIHPRGMDVTVAKLSGSKMLPKVTMRCMEMHGGYGVTTDYAIQRLHRDAVTSVVAGGAPAVLRNTIAAQLFPGFDFSQKAT